MMSDAGWFKHCSVEELGALVSLGSGVFFSLGSGLAGVSCTGITLAGSSNFFDASSPNLIIFSSHQATH